MARLAADEWTESTMRLTSLLRRLAAAVDRHTQVAFNPPLTRALIAAR